MPRKVEFRTIIQRIEQLDEGVIPVPARWTTAPGCHGLFNALAQRFPFETFNDASERVGRTGGVHELLPIYMTRLLVDKGTKTIKQWEGLNPIVWQVWFTLRLSGQNTVERDARSLPPALSGYAETAVRTLRAFEPEELRELVPALMMLIEARKTPGEPLHVAREFVREVTGKSLY